MRQGETEPQYQVWAAWSMVQAGYPEEAEPIVNHLLAEIAAGPRPPRAGGDAPPARRRDPPGPPLARRPEARPSPSTSASYSGKVAPAGVQLRMAQIDVQLGQGERALRRIDELRARGQGGPAAEHLAVLTLLEMGKPKEARDDPRRRPDASTPRATNSSAWKPRCWSRTRSRRRPTASSPSSSNATRTTSASS